MTETQAPPTEGLVGFRKKTAVGFPKNGFGVLVGHPKSGKTALAVDFPNAYVFELEHEGAEHVDGRVDNVRDVVQDGTVVKTALEAFRQRLLMAVNEPSVETIVVDTIDQLAAWIANEVAQKYGLATINERKQGVNGRDVWGEYDDRMAGLLGFFEECGKLVVLCAHCKNPEKDDAGTVIIPMGINVPGKKPAAAIAARAKFIGFCYKKEMGTGNAYYVTFKGGPLATWGSRVDELNDKTITLPKEKPFSAIRDVFEVKFKDPETKKGEVAPEHAPAPQKEAASQAVTPRGKPAPRPRAATPAGR